MTVDPPSTAISLAHIVLLRKKKKRRRRMIKKRGRKGTEKRGREKREIKRRSNGIHKENRSRSSFVKLKLVLKLSLRCSFTF